MEIKEKGTTKKSKRVIGSIVLYAAGITVAVTGIALLVTNVIYFRSLVSQYVSQGYSTSVVTKQLLLSQLLPAVFSSVGINGGIAALLIGAGIINSKVTKVSEISEAEEINSVEEINETEGIETAN